MTAKLAAEGAITRVDVLTDLNITGRPAQFGRGVMTDVGNKLLGQFADKLAAQLGEGDAQGDATAPRPRRGGRDGHRCGRGGRRIGRTVRRRRRRGQDGQEGGGRHEEGGRRRDGQGDGEGRTAGNTAAGREGHPREGGSREDHTDEGRSPPATPRRPRRHRPGGTATTAPGGKAPSGPPSGTTAPPLPAATGAPVRSVRRPGPRVITRPQEEPEPIDLLEVAGGAAMARYAAPAAGVAAIVVVIALLVRRRRRRAAEQWCAVLVSSGERPRAPDGGLSGAHGHIHGQVDLVDLFRRGAPRFLEAAVRRR